jgi:hypothetical protein
MARKKQKSSGPPAKLPTVRNRSLAPSDKHNVDFKKLIKLRYYNGLSLAEISAASGVPKSTLGVWFKPVDNLIKHPDELELYRNNRDTFLSSLEYELLSDLMDGTRRKKASLNNTGFVFDKIHQARRLEEGLSTGNLAVNVEKSLTDAHAKAQNQRDKLSDSAAS